MNRTVVVTALVVWLLISFVPALSAANIMRLGKGKSG
jgi:uncharacterized membrane protein